MPEDLDALSAAADAYRAAAVAAGLTWPAPPADPVGPPPDRVFRIFDVDHVPDQVTWFQSQGWHDGRVLPDGGWVEPWPTDPDQAFDMLTFSVGTPFLWRHQLPLFNFEIIVFTLVLTGDHEGEIWRYGIGPDTWQPVRAAPNLTALLTEWKRGLDAGVVVYQPLNGWLQVGDDMGNPSEVVRAHGLDPLAFPADIADEALLQQRQQECGVDLTLADSADAQGELADLIDEARRDL